MSASIYDLKNRNILVLCVLGLLLLGVLMVQSAASNVTGDTAMAWHPLAIKHIGFVACGMIVFFVIGHIDYRRFFPSRADGRPTSPLFHPVVLLAALAAILCAVTLIPHIGIEKNGARRWLPLGPAGQLQPSELAKWAAVFLLAWWCTAYPMKRDRLAGFTDYLLRLLPIGVLCLLVVIHDFGTAALIGLCAWLMLLVVRMGSKGKSGWWYPLAVLPPLLGVAFWFIRHKEYRWKRATSFLDPFADAQGQGYHMVQSLLSFSTGGIFGRGLGNGIQKLGYLPEDTTDFIFAVICEETGIFGALLTVALYIGILYVAWQAARCARDELGRLLAFGIGAMVTLQALINIAVATVSVPTKGLSLPLVSAGGSGLVITSAALGVLYSVCRIGEREAASTSAADETDAPVIGTLPLSANL